MSKIYKGKRVKVLKENIYAVENIVTVNGKRLALRLDLRKHSPDGFGWGYGGSGPALGNSW